MPFCEQCEFRRCAALPGNLLEPFLAAACPGVWALPARRGCSVLRPFTAAVGNTALPAEILKHCAPGLQSGAVPARTCMGVLERTRLAGESRGLPAAAPKEAAPKEAAPIQSIGKERARGSGAVPKLQHLGLKGKHQTSPGYVMANFSSDGLFYRTRGSSDFASKGVHLL